MLIITKQYVHTPMKDIADTVNDVCMVCQCNVLHDAVTVAMLPNGLQLRVCVQDKVPYKQCLHVPYKSELIITQMSVQTSMAHKEIYFLFHNRKLI